MKTLFMCACLTVIDQVSGQYFRESYFKKVETCGENFIPAISSKVRELHLNIGQSDTVVRCGFQCAEESNCDGINMCKNESGTFCQYVEILNSLSCGDFVDCFKCSFLEKADNMHLFNYVNVSQPVTLDTTQPATSDSTQSVTLDMTSLPVISTSNSLYDPLYPWEGDCSNVLGGGPQTSNVYTIQPSGAPTSFSVYCDVKPEGVYTRIMEHGGDCGTDDWNLPMSDYISGFGQNVLCDHWIGLENMFYLTNAGSNYKAEINIELENGNNDSVHYGYFLVKDTRDWTLRLDVFNGSTNNYLGNGFDNLVTSSSADLIDNEDFEANGVNIYGCSGGDKSGWWFSQDCLNTNLCLPLGNIEKALYPTTRQMKWPELSGYQQVVKHVTMQIRKTN